MSYNEMSEHKLSEHKMSILDLHYNKDNLKGTRTGMSNLTYEQYSSTRECGGAAFSKGQIVFPFEVSGTRHWVPSRSYIRCRATLTDSFGDQLTVKEGIGPNHGLMANLFQSAEFRIADKTISRISDYMPQIDALENRLSKSSTYLNSVGASLNHWEASVHDRIHKVSIDGTEIGRYDVEKIGRLELGYAAANTIAIADNDGTVTFANGGGAAPPAADADDLWRVGDILSMDDIEYRVFEVTDATSIKVGSAKSVAVAAGVSDFFRIRPEANRNMQSFEMIWTPPLSIFKIDHSLPSGKYSLVLNPQSESTFQKMAIESLVNLDPTGNYQFTVDSMQLYVCTFLGKRVDNVEYFLDLEETRLQVDKVGKGFGNRPFDISPSTYALTVAYQDNTAGTDSSLSASKFRVAGDAQNTLTRFFINYASKNFPSPDADPEYKVGEAVDYMAQRYAETMIHSGAYFDNSGCESIQEWRKRGAYYHWKVPKDGTDRSTRAVVNQQFENDLNTANVLVFDHSRSVALIKVKDGRVVDVQVEEQ